MSGERPDDLIRVSESILAIPGVDLSSLIGDTIIERMNRAAASGNRYSSVLVTFESIAEKTSGHIRN